MREMKEPFILLLLAAAAALFGAEAGCQRISSDFCNQLPYNETAFPNLVGNDNEDEASAQIDSFKSLVLAQCSSQLKFFLCSVYYPMCNMQIGQSERIIIGPCKPLCERVRKRCEPMLSQFGFPWPDTLNCSKFPENNDENSMCMPGHGEDPPPPTAQIPLRPRPPVHCPAGKNYIYVNRSGECALGCYRSGDFTPEEQLTAETLSFSMAVLGAAVSVLAILMLGCSHHSLPYPETPIQFMVGAYAFGTLPLIARFFAGRGVACTLYSGVSVLVVPGLVLPSCSVLAIILYAAWLAHQLWWLVLSWAVFLARGLNWSAEAIGRWSFWYHFFVWGTSCAGVVLALISHSVDASELFGMCGVGSGERRTELLLYFYIVPQLLVAILSATLLCFALLGHACAARNASKLPRVQRESALGLFLGLLYVPAGAGFAAACILQYQAGGPAAYSTQLAKLLAHSLLGVSAALGLILSASNCSCFGRRREERLIQGESQTPLRGPPKHNAYPSILYGEHPVI